MHICEGTKKLKKWSVQNRLKFKYLATNEVLFLLIMLSNTEFYTVYLLSGMLYFSQF